MRIEFPSRRRNALRDTIVGDQTGAAQTESDFGVDRIFQQRIRSSAPSPEAPAHQAVAGPLGAGCSVAGCKTQCDSAHRHSHATTAGKHVMLKAKRMAQAIVDIISAVLTGPCLGNAGSRHRYVSGSTRLGDRSRNAPRNAFQTGHQVIGFSIWRRCADHNTVQKKYGVGSRD